MSYHSDFDENRGTVREFEEQKDLDAPSSESSTSSPDFPSLHYNYFYFVVPGEDLLIFFRIDPMTSSYLIHSIPTSSARSHV